MIGSMLYETGKEGIDIPGDEAAVPKVTDATMIANYAFAVFLFIVNCGPFVFSENRAF